ncbi:hypothetical protein ACQPX6_27955 [Actinomycetospora sp. CA-101289]|uniref:hypothetical protein n=1 Tax=Actinomycetospora sp. CA-101289 TaxID=3239893 RepID=UPI003D97A574
MATSRLARLFGRKDDREADTAPPAYTGIGAPRQYEPPPGAPGHGTAGYRPGPAATTTYVPARPGPPAPTARPPAPAPRPFSPQEHAPVVTRARYDETARRRHAADQQVGILERQDAKLTAQIHTAQEQERHDYVRELVSRRIAVRSRLEESTLRRNRLQETEDELGAGLASYDAPSGPRWG